MQLKYASAEVINIDKMISTSEGLITAYNSDDLVVYKEHEVVDGKPTVWYKKKYNEDGLLIRFEDSCHYWENMEYFEGVLSYFSNSKGDIKGISTQEKTRKRMRLVK